MFTLTQARKALCGFVILFLVILSPASYAENPISDLKNKILDEFRSGGAPKESVQPASQDKPIEGKSGEAGTEDIPELKNKILEELQETSGKAAAGEKATADLEFKSVVPSLVGQTPEQARKTLVKYNLRLGVVAEIESTKPVGKIFKQSYKPNLEVKQFTEVSVTVAIALKDKETEAESDSSLVVVPDLSGLSLVAVKSKLSAASLNLGTVKKKSASGGAKGVLEQSEKAGEKVKAKTTVDVIIAKAPSGELDSEKDPSTVKYSIRLILDKKKVKMGESFALEAVIDPEPKEKLEYSFTIDRKVFPSDGKTLAHSLKKAGRIYVTANVRRPWQAWVHSKSSTLVVEEGEGTNGDQADVSDEKDSNADTNGDDGLVEVPNVVNMSFSRAVAALKVKGFKPGSITTKTLEGKERVLAQDPKAKKKMKKGSSVDLLKSEKLDVIEVNVPNVVGLSLSDAKDALKAVNLIVGIVGEKGALGKSRILQQVPVSNTSVAEGSKVNLVRAIALKVSFALSADKTEINQSEVVVFQGVLQPSELKEKAKYRLFIDETKIDAKASMWKHVFNEPGSYQVVAEVDIDGAGKFRSEPIMIKVNSVWQEPRALIDPPTLVVTQGDSATFTSQSTHDKSSYLESFWLDESGSSGDGKSYEISTQRWSPGEYWVSLRVKDSQGFENSDKAQLIVMAEGEEYVPLVGSSLEKKAGAFSLSLSASNSHVAVDKLVKFTIKQQPESKEIKRLVFGDGNDAHTSTLSSEHSFTEFGHYSVYVETSYQNKVVRSESISVWVWPSWLLIGGVGLGLLVLGGLFKLFQPKLKRLMKTRTSHVNYVPSTDTGEQRLNAEKTSADNTSELSMKAEVDEGQQRMLSDNKK